MYATAYPDPALQGQFYADVAIKRGLAWLFDSIFIAFLVALIVPFTGFLALFFLGGVYVVVSFLYRWMGLARHSGTLGMRMMGLEFRDMEGLPMTTAQAFAHTLFYPLSVAFVIPQIISVLLICFTARGQSLSDAVLGVVLINRSAMY